MQFTEIFISEFDSHILNIPGRNKLINLHSLIFCVIYNVDLPVTLAAPSKA